MLWDSRYLHTLFRDVFQYDVVPLSGTYSAAFDPSMFGMFGPGPGIPAFRAESEFIDLMVLIQS